MEKILLKCKTITPMFMAGADKKGVELRPSEFKGMMRWWWRAIKAENNIENLKKEEAEIFGGTGKGEGRSKVKINIIHDELNWGDNIRYEINNFEGLKYLYYSTFSLRERGEPIIRKYYKVNKEFSIVLSSLYEKYFKQGLASLWLAIYLGGFGTRARRGGGNLEIVEDSSESVNLEFICNAKNKDELVKWLKNNFEKAKNIIGQSSGTARYTNLKGAKILIFDPEKSWKDALNFLGEQYKDFRTKNKSKIFETVAFGMPVMHNKFRMRMVPYERKDKNGLLSDRWASPLIFKVIKVDSLYFPIIVKLSSGGVLFVGKEKRVNRDWKLDKGEVKDFDEKIIEKFLTSLPNKVEVNL